ncbi:hypothetical protein FHS20_001318 [Phyllobacterium endophyticum]|nr:hypothetical protein [Phyllobacterium endophyticum]
MQLNRTAGEIAISDVATTCKIPASGPGIPNTGPLFEMRMPGGDNLLDVNNGELAIHLLCYKLYRLTLFGL